VNGQAQHLKAATGDLQVLPGDVGWTYSGLRVFALEPGETRSFETGEEEMVVLPLNGGCTVSCDGETFEVQGRDSVFTRVSDFAYLPRDASATLTSKTGGRFALPSAVCSNRLSCRYVAADEVPVESRGRGVCSRQVNNFCAADVFQADRLIAVEVLTPSGNWSSYPPHKHDADHPGEESVLEEIYYFVVAGGPEGPGIGYQRVYGTEDLPEDLLVEVRTGDVVAIPHGWHGPSMAAPGYDLYYLNVMAGPSLEREWLIRDDPSHAWVRGAWDAQRVDPRLPLTSTDEKGE